MKQTLSMRKEMETYHCSSDTAISSFLFPRPRYSGLRSDSLGFLQDKLQPQWEVEKKQVL